MAERKIADKKPALVNLDPGTYWWCACGRSKGQPWCDGSHKGTEYTPMKIEVTEPQRMVLCQCKQTENPPHCDGGHRYLK
jgi:CDGSH-type Zn-finger protein